MSTDTLNAELADAVRKGHTLFASDDVETQKSLTLYYSLLRRALIKSQVDSARIVELTEEAGLLRIALEHSATVLASCEQALESRDADSFKDKTDMADL